jgi:thiamine kinase-like enzyme
VNLVLTPDAAFAHVFGDAKSAGEIKAIHASLTNRSYLVERDGQRLVLRLDTEHTASLGLDRDTELAVRRAAAAAGIAPRIYFADPAAGILVSEYLTGRAPDVQELANPPMLEAVADALRKVHALPVCGKLFAATTSAARYAELVHPDRELYAFAKKCAESIAAIPVNGRSRCCHNDIVAGNVIVGPMENGAVRLIDWEYACDNEPIFDLASLIGYHDLPAGPAEILLNAYTGGANSEDRERLALQLRLFDLLQWLWLAVQQLLAPKPQQRERLVNLRQRIDLHQRRA